MREENAIIEVPEKNITPVNPYDKMVEMALSSDVGIEKLEKLLDLKERHEANEAKKAYHLAMANFKANPPDIDKDGKVNFSTSKGVTSYSHATLGNVTQKINSALSEHGLSASWKTNQDNGQIKVTCIITHEQGYFESTSLVSSPETSGTKNSIQAICSAITYLQRYTILALTGLATREQDNDSIAVDKPLITDTQEADLSAMIEEKKIDLPKFLKYFNISKLSELWAETYPAAVQLIEDRK